MSATVNINHWRVHTPNLLSEILSNQGTAALSQPLRIFGHKLFDVAHRASELNDPELNKLMLQLTLYEIADPEIHPDQTAFKQAMHEIDKQIEGGSV